MKHELFLMDFSGIYGCKNCGKIFIANHTTICKSEELDCNPENKLNNFYMKKIVDIPEDVMIKIQHICVDEKTNPKKWIEKLIINEVNKAGRQNLLKTKPK